MLSDELALRQHSNNRPLTDKREVTVCSRQKLGGVKTVHRPRYSHMENTTRFHSLNTLKLKGMLSNIKTFCAGVHVGYDVQNYIFRRE